jgi:peptidyl-Lys metalloendopeptidase
VTDHFQKISSHDFNSYKFDCTCTESGTYAYVYPGTFGTVYLCGVFWQVNTTGTDSQGGTLVHESSHFTINGGTNDYVYGQAGAKSLAQSNPKKAVSNADSHEYFAENNPVLS